MQIRHLNLINSPLLPTLLLVAVFIFPSLANAKEQVRIFAAASLTQVITELSDAYQKENHVEISVSFAGSSTLARQISQGAPTDIYLSASNKWMDYLIDHGFIEKGSKKELLQNALVLIAPLKSPIQSIQIDKNWNISKSLGDLRIAIAEPDSVPAGIYAKQSLQALNLWDSVQSKLAVTSNVRAALALVERNEAGLGIVYKTDALSSKGVKQVGTFAEQLHEKINYPIGIIKGQNNPETIQFYEYLQSNKATKVFKKYGFINLSQ